MKKLAGTDLIVLMKAASNDESFLKEAKSLDKNDFNSEDLIVDCFFKAFPDGFKSAGFSDHERVKTSIEALVNIKREISNQGLRKAHNYLQNLRSAQDEAVLLESEINNVSSRSYLDLQLNSAKMLTFLSKYADGHKNRTALADAVKDVHNGDFESATSKIKTVFSHINPEKVVKTAFVTIKQQVGESYQMCPKAIYQSGRPVPMALSSCRDYCIDSRLNPDGTVGCNYLKWLNENLITQEQALNLFDKMDYGQDGVEFMNLEKGERTHFPVSDQDSQDMRMGRDEERTEDITSKTWEEQLETAHKKPENKPQKGKTIMSDSALELLLKDTRDVFDEDDLDTLEEQIRKLVGE